MVKLMAWLRRRGYGSDVKQLSKQTTTIEGRLVALDHMVNHLLKCTFTGKPIVDVNIEVIRKTPIASFAHTCDDLLLALNDASEIVEQSGNYRDFFYSRRTLEMVLPRKYFTDNNHGLDIPIALFVAKFLTQAQMLISALNEKISEAHPESQHHLRRTSELVAETLEVTQYLLALSDQRLIPPSA